MVGIGCVGYGGKGFLNWVFVKALSIEYDLIIFLEDIFWLICFVLLGRSGGVVMWIRKYLRCYDVVFGLLVER